MDDDRQRRRGRARQGRGRCAGPDRLLPVGQASGGRALRREPAACSWWRAGAGGRVRLREVHPRRHPARLAADVVVHLRRNGHGGGAGRVPAQAEGAASIPVLPDRARPAERGRGADTDDADLRPARRGVREGCPRLPRRTPRPERKSCSGWCGCRMPRLPSTSTRTSSRAGSSSASASRWRWPPGRPCWSWTNPRPVSTWSPRPRSWTPCPGCTTNSGCRWSSSATTSA